MATTGKQDGYAVRSVVRAARILELVRTSEGGAQLNELASRSGLAKASAFRLLRTLEQVGLIQRVPNSDVYRLGVRCLELGKAMLASLDGDPAAVLSERGELRRYTANTICDRDALREELARIRKRGFAVDLEEHEVGVRCVASTIHAPREVAAISVAGPAQRLPERRLRRELGEAVIAAAGEISRRLGSPQRREAGDAPRR